MIETERAASGPGVLDDGVMGERQGGSGHGSRSLSRFLLFLWVLHNVRHAADIAPKTIPVGARLAGEGVFRGGT